MDLFKKNKRFERKTFNSNHSMYFGKIALLTLGAFAAAMAITRNDPEEMLDKVDNML